ncbi:Nn.00g080550.m01.CDS01 [Neocucurbitaria sp. VM-36]
MSFLLNSTLDYILAMDLRKKSPAYHPPKLNRIDADPKLLHYHDTDKGMKPLPREETIFLPLRTRIAVGLFSAMHAAQTHAYYEEIDSIPAASVGQTSEFKAGHWYVIHPVSAVEMLDFSTKVLQDLGKWLDEDCPDDLFTGKNGQVRDFKKVRDETRGNFRRELGKREGRGDVGEEEGYVGSWERIGDDGREVSGEMEVEEDGKGKGEEMAPISSRHTVAALAEAEEAGRKAAEEAKIKDEYEFM